MKLELLFLYLNFYTYFILFLQLKSESRVLFRTLTMDARRLSDAELAKALASHLKTAEHLPNRAKAVAYSCVLDVLGKKFQLKICK